MRNLLILLAALLAWGAGPAHAQTYPERGITIVIGFPPGGAIDTIARVMGPKLSQRLGPPVVIENKPGAGGIIATQMVARAPADGYTVLFGTMGNLSITPVLMHDLQFDMKKDFAPVTLVASSGFVLYVHPQFPPRTVKELIDYAKAHPGQVNFSSSGNGGLPHMAGELFNSSTGLKITHVPYKGSAPSVNDVVAGQVQMTFESAAIGLPFVKAGRLRALATTGEKRLPVYPDVPTVAETVPGFTVTNWFGMVVPAGTPQDRIEKLQQGIAGALADPEVKETLAKLGVDGVGNRPAEFGAYMQAESERWAGVIKEAGIRVD